MQPPAVNPVRTGTAPPVVRQASPPTLEELARDAVESGAVLMRQRRFRLPWMDREVPIDTHEAVETLREGQPGPLSRLRVKPADSSVPLKLSSPEDLSEVAALAGRDRPVSHPDLVTHLRALAQAGWRFFSGGDEVGLYGAYNAMTDPEKPLENLTVVQQDVRIPLDGTPGQAEAVCRFYTSPDRPLAAVLEQHGFRFFNASLTPLSAFESGSETTVGRPGEGWLPVSRISSLEEMQRLASLRDDLGYVPSAIQAWEVLGRGKPSLQRAVELLETRVYSDEAATAMAGLVRREIAGHAELDTFLERALAAPTGYTTRMAIMRHAVEARTPDEAAGLQKWMEAMRGEVGESELERVMANLQPSLPLDSDQRAHLQELTAAASQSGGSRLALIESFLAGHGGNLAALASAWLSRRNEHYTGDRIAVARALLERMRKDPATERSARVALASVTGSQWQDAALLEAALKHPTTSDVASLAALGADLAEVSLPAAEAVLTELKAIPEARSLSEMALNLGPEAAQEAHRKALYLAVLENPSATPVEFARALAERVGESSHDSA
ncbi:MAG: hypothetical protein AB1758_17120, partial [Candidatus Eremiobacterota bacterium]